MQVSKKGQILYNLGPGREDLRSKTPKSVVQQSGKCPLNYDTWVLLKIKVALRAHALGPRFPIWRQLSSHPARILK